MARAQAASGYLEHHADGDRYRLGDEAAPAFADPGGLRVPGAFRLVTSAIKAQPEIVERFRSGEGFGWHEHDAGLFSGTEELVGLDYHGPSVDAARRAAADAGQDGRGVRFEVASATDFPGEAYDLVAMLDCLHDMGDPRAAAAHVRRRLAPDGTWMIVEPFAGDRVEDNLNPVGRTYYAASTPICTPSSLAQDGRAALGSQAGEAALGEVIRSGGFTRVRRAAETPLVLEARP